MSDEDAKAIQEVAKATGKGIDTIRGFGGFLHAVFGAGLQELGGVMHDRIVLYRYTNMIRIADKVERIHKERRISGKLIPIPPRYALPLLERASLDNDESLQDMWAGLIANASDPQKRLGVKKVYLDLLQSLEPLDASILTYLRGRHHLRGALSSTFIDIRIHTGATDQELSISLENLARLGCIRQEKDRAWDEMSKMGFDASDVGAGIVLTTVGSSLVDACQHLQGDTDGLR